MDGDITRGRFERSPRSLSSETTTTCGEWGELSRHDAKQQRETWDLNNSSAGEQFRLQSCDEEKRIYAASERGLFFYSCPFDCANAARANVKQRWIEQGIWNVEWKGQFPSGLWRHELPIDKPSQLCSSSGSCQTKTDRASSSTKRKRVNDESDNARIEETRIIDARARDASRPCYQFVYQVGKEREWIIMGLSNKSEDHDLDTAAYQNVRHRWINEGIWDISWSYLPGLSWRHEKPLKYPFNLPYALEQEALKASAEAAALRPPKVYLVVPHDGYRPVPQVLDRTSESNALSGNPRGAQNGTSPILSSRSPHVDNREQFAVKNSTRRTHTPNDEETGPKRRTESETRSVEDQNHSQSLHPAARESESSTKAAVRRSVRIQKQRGKGQMRRSDAIAGRKLAVSVRAPQNTPGPDAKQKRTTTNVSIKRSLKPEEAPMATKMVSTRRSTKKRREKIF